LQEKITIALDSGTSDLLAKMKADAGLTQSEVLRQSLKFFGKHKRLFELDKMVNIYSRTELLTSHDSIILDLDHWILFLRLIETHPDREKFYIQLGDICRDHAGQLKEQFLNAESILRRMEVCNLFKVNKIGRNQFSLVFNCISAKNFFRKELEMIFADMGFLVEIKEGISKLRIKVISDL